MSAASSGKQGGLGAYATGENAHYTKAYRLQLIEFDQKEIVPEQACRLQPEKLPTSDVRIPKSLRAAETANSDG